MENKGVCICLSIIGLHCCSLNYVICKACGQEPVFNRRSDLKAPPFEGRESFHSGPFLRFNDVKAVEQLQNSEKPSSGNGGAGGNAKVMRKKMKGKRAVVRWLKFFRWKKKKEFERMTAEEKLLYKLLKVSSLLFLLLLICRDQRSAIVLK